MLPTSAFFLDSSYPSYNLPPFFLNCEHMTVFFNLNLTTV